MRRNTAWRCAALAALVLMGIGLLSKELAVVLNKATHICLECIGIG